MENNLTIQGRNFYRDGKKVFMLCDTAWFALMNLTVEEFEEYAVFRAEQGYNGLLMQNTPAFQDMPKQIKYFPFYINEDGSYDLSRWREEYFDMVRQKLDILKKLSITPFIVPMWVTFIPHSQMSKVFDTTGKTFQKFEHYAAFVDRSIEVYKPYHPVWVLGGDAEMRDQDVTNYEYYSYMAKRIRKECPGDLITAHTAGGQLMDERYGREGLIDFYMYQSGHMYDTFESLLSPIRLAKSYLENDPTRPVMNAEPMYEAHGFGNKFGRFTESYLRRAFWYSVLSGAQCGFTYGAHGVWMFYDNSGFNNEAWSLVPMHWRSALALPGSYDVAMCADLFKRYDLFELEPRQDLNLTPYHEIVAAADPNEDIIVFFTPYMNYIYVDQDLSDYECVWHIFGEHPVVLQAQIEITTGQDIANALDVISAGQIHKPKLSESLLRSNAVTVVNMPQYNADALLVCRKK